MDDDKEVRSYATGQLEVRMQESKPTQIVGYAAVFNQLSQDIQGFREQIAPGAFAESIRTDNVYALWQHRADIPLASKDSSTLVLREDGIGLVAEITPPDTAWGRDAIEAVRSGLVKHFSFGFTVKSDSWDFGNPKMPVRTLNQVQLYEISPVTFPAYPQTSASVRAQVTQNTHMASSVDTTANDDSARAREDLLMRVKLAKIQFP